MKHLMCLWGCTQGPPTHSPSERALSKAMVLQPSPSLPLRSRVSFFLEVMTVGSADTFVFINSLWAYVDMHALPDSSAHAWLWSGDTAQPDGQHCNSPAEACAEQRSASQVGQLSKIIRTGIVHIHFYIQTLQFNILFVLSQVCLHVSNGHLQNNNNWQSMAEALTGYRPANERADTFLLHYTGIPLERFIHTCNALCSVCPPKDTIPVRSWASNPNISTSG